MEILALLFAIAVLIGIIAGYACLIGMLNSHSEEHHGYTPVTFGKSCLMLLPLALIGFGLFALHEPKQVSHAETTALVSFVSAGLILVAMYWRISRQSSARIAILAMTGLLLNATLILGVICIYIFLVMLRSESRRNRRY